MAEKTYAVLLREKELNLIQWVLKTQINWGTGGCFGDGDNITEKKELALAKKIVEIISNLKGTQNEK